MVANISHKKRVIATTEDNVWIHWKLENSVAFSSSFGDPCRDFVLPLKLATSFTPKLGYFF